MEKISIVDEKDRVLFDVVKKEFDKDSGNIYRVVGVVVVNSLGDILIHKRQPKKGSSYGNMWSLAAASGHVMAGEDYESAAVRELAEEVGLIVDQGDMEFVGKTLVCYGKRRRFLAYYMAKVDFDLNHLDVSEREIAEIKIVSKSKFKDFIFENSDNIIDYGNDFFEELIHRLTK